MAGTPQFRRGIALRATHDVRLTNPIKEFSGAPLIVVRSLPLGLARAGAAGVVAVVAGAWHEVVDQPDPGGSGIRDRQWREASPSPDPSRTARVFSGIPAAQGALCQRSGGRDL